MKNIRNYLISKLIFKKIPKTRMGRCVECDARRICYKSFFKCTCNMEQQYKLRDFREITIMLEKIL